MHEFSQTPFSSYITLISNAKEETSYENSGSLFLWIAKKLSLSLAGGGSDPPGSPSAPRFDISLVLDVLKKMGTNQNKSLPKQYIQILTYNTMHIFKWYLFNQMPNLTLKLNEKKTLKYFKQFNMKNKSLWVNVCYKTNLTLTT